MRCLLAVLALAVVLAGCSGAAPPAGPPGTAAAAADAAEMFPDVVDVTVTPGTGGFTFAVTISSPYDTSQRYADAFRARSADGTVVYGVTELSHDHAGEQPFTRTLTAAVPEDVASVVVEGRDLVHGWGGGTVTVELPR